MNIRFYNARILTMEENRKIFSGELWIKGNKIIYVGDAKSQQKFFEQNKNQVILWDREIDLQRNLIMPGFKDAHTHSGMTFLRSFADDMPLERWLNEQIFPMEAKIKSDDIYYLTKLAIMEYLASGITSGFDMYISPDATAKAAADCGFRMMLVSPLNNFTSSLQKVEEDYCKYKDGDGMISYFLGFHAEYTTSLELMEGIAHLAQKYHAPVYMHNSETETEVLECKKRYGITPTQLFDKLGIYDYGGGGYHCVYFDEKDIEIFKKKDLSVVTNPASNLKLASGLAPIKRFADENINVAIGTDGPASNNCLDMFREMFLTTALAKLRQKDASVLPADKVLYMATVGGAKAMELTDADVLAAGKKADMTVIDLQQPNMQPINNIVKNIVYSGSKQNIKMTIVNGEILYEDGNYNIGCDSHNIYQKANEIIRRITT